MIKRLFHSLLYQLDPEDAHDAVMWALSKADRWLDDGWKAKTPANCSPELATKVCGIRFPNPIGLAAGFDKNAVATKSLVSLGFGYIETGTVTRHVQFGNPRPRITRHIQEESLTNSMGFPSVGIEEFAKNIALRTWKVPVGVNIGLNKNIVERGEAKDAIHDILHCIEMTQKYASYYTLNLSSPNTPGLRELGNRAFSKIYKPVKNYLSKTGDIPLWVKVSPDMGLCQLTGFAKECITIGVDGLIATNTSQDQDTKPNPKLSGGASGECLKVKSLYVLDSLYTILKGRIPIISVGGIDSPGEAVNRILHGADLVQIYTGLIFRGPDLVKDCLTGMKQFVQINQEKSIFTMQGEEHSPRMLRNKNAIIGDTELV